MVQKIPILKIGNALIASIQIELNDESAVQFKEDILNQLSVTGAAGVVIDLTAVDMVDSFLGAYHRYRDWSIEHWGKVDPLSRFGGH